MTPDSTQSERVCRGCGARGGRLSQEAHATVCERADVVAEESVPRYGWLMAMMNPPARLWNKLRILPRSCDER